MDAWVARPSGTLVVRICIEHDRPVFLMLEPGPVSRAIGGLDMVAPGRVVALRVICDGAMTRVGDRLRLDMATWAILLVGAGPDRQELDDCLCDLAVELSRPGRYESMRVESPAPAASPALFRVGAT